MNAITPSERALASLLEERTGQHISPNRGWRIDNALAGLYRQHRIHSMQELASMLRQWPDSSLSQQVVDALLNNETYFFRDHAMFDALVNNVLPAAASQRQAQKRLSIWSAGCSTGQEAYSLAMAIAEQPERWDGWTIDIIGTDVSPSIIEAAKRGCYSAFQVQRGLGVMQMLNWFDETADGWVIRDALRRKVQFRQHNILDPLTAFRKFDIVLCRNVLLYFDAERRRTIFERLESAMVADGWLMLGAGESIIGQTQLFVNDANEPAFFRRSDRRQG
jgi:chemotaxis protein methyltransferase CheR